MGRKVAENNAPPLPVLPTKDLPLVPPPLPRLRSEQDKPLTIMLDVSRPPEERAEAGRKINQVPGGDPRPGVLDFNWDEGYWRLVPKGEFQMGTDQGEDNLKSLVKIDYDFWIAKYPITWSQWKRFLDHPGGYRNPDWWKELHPKGKAQQGGAGVQRFKFGNHPAENVSWYDAMAFCRWLDARWKAKEIKLPSKEIKLPSAVPTGYVLRLPLESEWEKAASWDTKKQKAREYP